MIEWLSATNGISNGIVLVLLIGILGLVAALTLVVFKGK
jgi:hypothetical protein